MVTWLLLTGCWPELPPCPDCAGNSDRDGDGFSPNEGDCDDTTDAIGPGAVETCNGIDDDCDGEIDVGAAEVEPRYVDEDGDGFGAGDPVIACPGAAATAAVDGDCDDADAAVNPEVDEVCNDGVDNDCDGTANPCERTGLWRLGDADALIASQTPLGGFGRRLAVGPDGVLVASGFVGQLLDPPYRFASRSEWPEVLVAQEAAEATLQGAGLGNAFAADGAGWLLAEADGDRGVVHVLPGGLVGEPTASVEADGSRRGSFTESIGRLVASGPDGIFFTSDAGGTIGWWVEAPVRGALDVADDVGATPLPGSLVPDTVALGDLDGDGASDVAFGVIADGPPLNSGAVYVYLGPLKDRGASGEPDAVLRGPGINRRIGGGLAIVPDLDGDGNGELVVSGPDSAANPDVWVVRGPPSSGEVTERAWLTFEGEPGSGLGRAIGALDVNVDGATDLVIAAPDDDESGANAGVVFVEQGPFAAGRRRLDDAALVLLGEGAGHETGAALGTGDLDGDGFDDLAIGAPGESSLRDNAGAVYVWLSRGQ